MVLQHSYAPREKSTKKELHVHTCKKKVGAGGPCSLALVVTTSRGTFTASSLADTLLCLRNGGQFFLHINTLMLRQGEHAYGQPLNSPALTLRHEINLLKPSAKNFRRVRKYDFICADTPVAC